jgi:hypothetical protein
MSEGMRPRQKSSQPGAARKRGKGVMIRRVTKADPCPPDSTAARFIGVRR